MRISDWSSDVCSSDLRYVATSATIGGDAEIELRAFLRDLSGASDSAIRVVEGRRAPLPPGPPMSTAAIDAVGLGVMDEEAAGDVLAASPAIRRSEEHTSELQSLMRIAYAGFCCKIQIGKPSAATGG